MFTSLFESIKYIGHQFPVAVLRLYLGIYFLDQALERYHGDFLTHPRLAELIRDWSSASPAPNWYKDILDQLILPQWQLTAYCVVYFQFVIGISFILGFFVRPAALLGILLSLNFVFWSPPDLGDLYRLHLLLFVILGWIGAGRCLGLDYYFYKRHRGIWW